MELPGGKLKCINYIGRFGYKLELVTYTTIQGQFDVVLNLVLLCSMPVWG